MKSVRLTFQINVCVPYRMDDGLDSGDSRNPPMKYIECIEVPPSEPEKYIISASE